MVTFLVDRDLPGASLDDVRTIQRAAVAVCSRFCSSGTMIVFVQSLFIPGEQRCLCLFAAHDEATVIAVNQAAALPYTRVVTATCLKPTASVTADGADWPSPSAGRATAWITDGRDGLRGGNSMDEERGFTRANQRAAEGERVWVVINSVRSDHWEQHQRFVHEILAPAVRQVAPEAFQRVRFLHPTTPESDGTLTSIWLMDPVVSEANYDIPSLLRRAYGEEQARVHLELWDTALARPQVMYVLTQSAW
jgi:hypothetical protein